MQWGPREKKPVLSCCLCSFKTDSTFYMNEHIEFHFASSLGVASRPFSPPLPVLAGKAWTEHALLQDSSLSDMEYSYRVGRVNENAICGLIADHLGVNVERLGDGTEGHDFRIGTWGRGEAKSHAGKRASMIMPMSKLRIPRMRPLWLIYSNRNGVWITKCGDTDTFCRNFPAATEVAGWAGLCLVVPVTSMTKIAQFSWI